MFGEESLRFNNIIFQSQFYTFLRANYQLTANNVYILSDCVNPLFRGTAYSVRREISYMITFILKKKFNFTNCIRFSRHKDFAVEFDKSRNENAAKNVSAIF